MCHPPFEAVAIPPTPLTAWKEAEKNSLGVAYGDIFDLQ